MRRSVHLSYCQLQRMLEYLVSRTFSLPLHNRSFFPNIWPALFNLTGQLNRNIARAIKYQIYVPGSAGSQGTRHTLDFPGAYTVKVKTDP